MDSAHFAKFSLVDKLAKTDASANRNYVASSTYTASLTTNPQSNLRPQIPAQPNPNPNNKPVQSIQIIETSEIGVDLRECNDLQLRSGRIIETEGEKTADIENQLPREHLTQEEDVNKQKTHNQTNTSSPPFPKRLVIPRPIQYPDFYILGELQNLYIKIRFLQAIQDIPIYAKTIKELCVKNQGGMEQIIQESK